MSSWLKHVETLKAGETVSFRPHGSSMQPMISSGQLITVEPLSVQGPPKEGEAVLCKVKGRFMVHKVIAVRDEQALIGNNSGHHNGWTTFKNIFGRVVKIEK